MSTSASGTTRTKKHRVLDIEQALRWAYQSELPKRREDRAITAPVQAQVHPMWRAGAFGGRIDCWHRDPGFPLAMGDPHADALRIEAAVDALDEDALNISAYRIGEGLGDHVDLRHVTSITRRDVRSWIITYARSGKRPPLGTAAEFEPVRGPNGKAIIWEVAQVPAGEGPDGEIWFTTFERRAAIKSGGQYPDGAFCKLNWLTAADDIAEDRVRYALWHAALIELAEILRQVLQESSVTPPAAAMRPWAEPAIEAAPRALPSLAPRPVVAQRRSVAMRAARQATDPGRVLPKEQWPERWGGDRTTA